MSHPERPDLSLFLDILRTLERIDAPYMIIGAFAGSFYGVMRMTRDIDIIASLDDRHIQALVAAYPSPRYYADPVQMADSIQAGIMFNIIDGERGEKADLMPLVRGSPYSQAFRRRVRQTVEVAGEKPFAVWCARADDVIVGKLMAWAEGRSRRHETDIYEMMVFRLRYTSGVSAPEDFEEAFINARAKALGEDVDRLWQAIQEAARREAEK